MKFDALNFLHFNAQGNFLYTFKVGKFFFKKLILLKGGLRNRVNNLF